MGYETLPAMTRLFLLSLLSAQDVEEQMVDGRGILLLALPGMAETMMSGMSVVSVLVPCLNDMASRSVMSVMTENGAMIGIALSGIVPGVALYALSVLTGGAVGEGDAMTVWAVGFGSGCAEVLAWLTTATIPAGFIGLWILRKNSDRVSGRNPGRESGQVERIPFLPFLLFGNCLLTLWC